MKPASNTEARRTASDPRARQIGGAATKRALLRVTIRAVPAAQPRETAVTMTHLPDTAPTDGRPGPGNRGGSGDRKGGPRITDIRGLDGGRVVRALAWARSGDQTRASQLGALHLGRPAR